MAFQMLHYSVLFSKQQIDYARSIGTAEQDMHKTLLSLESKKTPEEAKEEMTIEKEGKRCPYCGKVWPADQRTRYRNRHRNACERTRARRNQIQISEQTQPASPSVFSQPSSSHASPSSSLNSTASSASSISSPSRSPKRKVDDANDLSSGDDQMGGNTKHNSKREQSIASPSAKRPKLAGENANEPIIGKASFKQQSGAIDIDSARRFVTWQPQDRKTAQPVVIRIADLKNFQRNTAGSLSNPHRGLVLRIITQGLGEQEPSSHIFRFPSTDDGRRDADAISGVLTPFGEAARTREHVPQTTTGQGVCTTSKGADNVEEEEEDDEESSDVEWETVI